MARRQTRPPASGAQPAALAIPVRRMDFSFAAPGALDIVAGDRSLSCALLGLSLMLPPLESFLIRTVQAASLVRDGGEAARRFCAQEGQHLKEHAAFNAAVRRGVGAAGRLAALERRLSALYGRWSRSRPLAFRLAYAEGCEAMTCAAARTALEVGLFDEMTEPARSLFAWHAVEEFEHRAVCHDLSRRAGGSAAYRFAVGLWAQAHFLGWSSRFATAVAGRVAADAPGMPAASLAGRRHAFSERVQLRVLATHLPGYDPRRLSPPPGFAEAAAGLAARAAAIR